MPLRDPSPREPLRVPLRACPSPRDPPFSALPARPKTWIDPVCDVSDRSDRSDRCARADAPYARDPPQIPEISDS